MNEDPYTLLIPWGESFGYRSYQNTLNGWNTCSNTLLISNYLVHYIRCCINFNLREEGVILYHNVANTCAVENFDLGVKCENQSCNSERLSVVVAQSAYHWILSDSYFLN